MKAYSEDLRRKIVDAVVERGMPKAQAAKTFGVVGITTVKRYASKARRGESLELGKAPGKRPKMDEKVSKLLEEDLHERPFVTLRERCDYTRGHKRCFGESLHRVPRHSQDRLHAQKGGRSATERDEFLRAAWRRVIVAAEIDPKRLVFVDEMGVHTSLAPLYGYSRKPE